MNNFDSPLPITSFSANYTAALAAAPTLDLRALVSREPMQKGEAHWIQSYRPKGAWDSETTGAWLQEAARTRNSGAVPRRNWEATATADQTFANWQKRLTPHQDIDFYMTLCNKEEIETGHEFESHDLLDMSNDPTSHIMRTLANGFVIKRNANIIAALSAATSTRKKLDMKYYSSGTTKNENFGKVVTVAENWTDNNPYANYETANAGYLSLVDDCPILEANLEACGVPNTGRKIILINPFDAAQMKIKSFDKLYSKDFPWVEKTNLASGELPEIFGFSFVKCKQIPKGTMYAFVPEAISMVPYLDLEQALDRDIMLRNHLVWYAHEEWGAVRNDDWGVSKITIKSATQSE